MDLHSPVSSFTCIAAFSQLAFQEHCPSTGQDGRDSGLPASPTQSRNWCKSPTAYSGLHTQCQHVCMAVPVGVLTCVLNVAQQHLAPCKQRASSFSPRVGMRHICTWATPTGKQSGASPHLVNVGPGPKWTPRTSSQNKGWDQVGAKSTWLTNASKSGFRTLRHLVQGKSGGVFL